MRLLLLEDDPVLGEGLRDYLRTEGHVVDWCLRVGDASLLLNEPYDALLIDWQLPDGSGLDWLRRLRQRGVTTSALMLTARDLLSDRVQGLDAGADDYLVKPFAPEELAARLRAVSRRSAGTGGERIDFGTFQVDLTAKTVWQGPTRVELTAREWALLEALVLRVGRIVSRSNLDALVIGQDADVNSNVLEVHISNLRRKLGRGVIETVRGLGYRMATPGT
ncbi:response regulator transcription factor [Sphaerotilus sp.]|uniref:response regulator transcription factor n=1 Tax=Sphaerotilus sp. TaxID=2093942 RepID=UPI002ACDE40A|nr:response regulator transcription factor [Sphaerotilus sp.]MDZ7858421.1 response regulator transcription factor [Sphaerotilus sp.]